MLTPVDQMIQPKVKSGKPDISILDESLFSGVAKTNKLLCSVNPEFIALSLVDVHESKFCGFEAFRFHGVLNDDQLAQKIRSLTEQSEILKKVDFTNVSVQIVNHKYTFVPASLFRNEDAEQYYSLNHGNLNGAEIKHDAIRAYDAINVFSMPEVIHSALKKIFEQFSCHHHATALLEAIGIQSRKREGKSLFVHFHFSLMDVIVTEGKKLLLCNTFSFKNNEDALYYLLFVCEQAGLNTEQISMEVSGQVEKASVLSELLHKYIKNISFSERIKSVKFTYGFDALPAHFYYSVFSQILI